VTELVERAKNGPDQGLLPSPWAVTERGKVIHKTEAEVKGALRLLALNGGQQRITCKQLRDEGFPIKEQTLAWWRDRSFPRLYLQIRKEVGGDVGEQIAGRALERALEADDVERAYIEEAKAKVGEVDPNHLAKNALALSNAKANNVEKAQLLRGQPTEIVEVDVNASIEVLERLGVAEKAIDVESEEIE
jgi:hypothetical protein